MFSEDVENLRVHVYHNLRPFVRRSVKSQFKLNISSNMYRQLKKHYHLTGRFKDASHIIDEFSLPSYRQIEEGTLKKNFA